MLLVLTLLPFTDPFPTFDLGALTHAADAASPRGWVAPDPSAAGLAAVNTVGSQPPGEESLKELSASKSTVTVTETVLLSTSDFRTIGSLSPRATLGFARRTPTLRL